MEDDLKELLRYLMDSGTGYESTETPLHEAAMACDERMVFLLLKYGARVTNKYWERTPLERARFYSRYVRTNGEYANIIRMLEEAEAKLRSNQTEKK